MPRRLAFALLVILALLTASGTASADGTLLAPTTLSDAPATRLAVSMAPNGYAITAWDAPLDGGQFALAVSTRPPGGDWSRPDLLGASARDKLGVSAAVDAGGDVAVAWEEIVSAQTQSFVASRATGGSFTSAEQLADAPSVESPAVGIDASGRVTLLYVPNPALAARDFQAGASALAAAPQLVFAGGTSGCVGAALAVAPSGDAVADGFCFDGALFALRRGGAWHVAPVVASDLQTCPATSTSRTPAGVAIDPQGHAVGLMLTEIREGIDFGFFCMITRTTDTLQLVMPVGDVMTPVATPVATASVEGESAALAWGRVGVSPSGVLAAWTANDGGPMRLKVRDFAFDGAPAGAEQTLDPSADVVAPQLAVGEDGRALLIWLRNAGIGAPPLEVATRPPGGAFAAPVEATPAAGGATAVALDAAGDGAVGFLDDPARFVQVRGFDAAPPVLSGVSIPATAAVGQPLAFSASPSDVWSALTTGWSFGDGATATGASVTHAYASAGTFTASVTGTDAVGNAVTRSGTVQVTAPVAGAGASAGPAISRLALTHRRFRVGRARTAVSARRRRAPVGTTFRFVLDRAASVKIAFARKARGLRFGRHCVKPSRRLRRAGARRCTRLVAVRPALTRAARAGANAVPFSGRIGRRALTPAAYVATLTATADGRAGPPSSIRFRVVR